MYEANLESFELSGFAFNYLKFAENKKQLINKIQKTRLGKIDSSVDFLGKNV